MRLAVSITNILLVASLVLPFRHEPLRLTDLAIAASQNLFFVLDIFAIGNTATKDGPRFSTIPLALWDHLSYICVSANPSLKSA